MLSDGLTETGAARYYQYPSRINVTKRLRSNLIVNWEAREVNTDYINTIQKLIQFTKIKQ